MSLVPLKNVPFTIGTGGEGASVTGVWCHFKSQKYFCINIKGKIMVQFCEKLLQNVPKLSMSLSSHRRAGSE